MSADEQATARVVVDGDGRGITIYGTLPVTRDEFNRLSAVVGELRNKRDDHRARARELAANVAAMGPLEPLAFPDTEARGVIVWRTWLADVLALLHEIGDE